MKAFYKLSVAAVLTLAVLAPTTEASARDRLTAGMRLTTDQQLQSANGYFRLIMQGDGNLVLYGPHSLPLWFSNTVGAARATLIMQGDGNAVVYSGGRPVWFTGTAGHPGSTLVMQEDGNLVLYSSAWKPLWASNTARPAKRQIRAFDFNMSGNVLNGGEVNSTRVRPDHSRIPSVVDAIVASIRDQQPEVVTLQEVCEAQYWAIKERTGMDGRLGVHTRFPPHPGDPRNPCGENGGAYGVAVFTRERMIRDGWWNLPREGSEQRMLYCGETRSLMACTSHLTPNRPKTPDDPGKDNSALQAQQIQFIANVLAPYIREGVAVVLGMDAYTPISGLTPLKNVGFKWASHPTPTHVNENHCPDAPNSSDTTCNGPLKDKIDHILFSQNRFQEAVDDEATSTRHSDHLPVRAWTYLAW